MASTVVHEHDADPCCAGATSALLPIDEASRLERGYPDALLVAATLRESTRGLLDRIALSLKDRWRLAELAPPRDAVFEEPTDEQPPAEELTTLDELMGGRLWVDSASIWSEIVLRPPAPSIHDPSSSSSRATSA